MRISDWSSDVCSSDLVGPPGVEALLVGAQADGRGVVDERVVPDVEDVARRPRHRHAPVEAGSRDRNVAEALAEEAEHLVAIAFGRDDLGILLDPVDKALLVAGEADDAVPFLQDFALLALGHGADAASGQPLAQT